MPQSLVGRQRCHARHSRRWAFILNGFLFTCSAFLMTLFLFLAAMLGLFLSVRRGAALLFLLLRVIHRVRRALFHFFVPILLVLV